MFWCRMAKGTQMGGVIMRRMTVEAQVCSRKIGSTLLACSLHLFSSIRVSFLKASEYKQGKYVTSWGSSVPYIKLVQQLNLIYFYLWFLVVQYT